METIDFWDNQAREHGMEPVATAPDIHYRALEIRAIKSVMANPRMVLDVGCGNGYTTADLAHTFPAAMFNGIDNSPEMIAAAKKHGHANLNFEVADIREIVEWSHGMKWDHIVSCRCLINLPDWDAQRAAIDNMSSLLTADGRLVLVENVDGGLDRLNAARNTVGLQPIQQRWHNHYLPEKEVRKHLNNNYTVIDDCNIGSPYYIISRVVYAAICAERGIEPSYDNELNEIASRLPVTGDCSPNYVFVIKRKGGA